MWSPGQKPTQPVEIDWSHPMAEDLVFYQIGYQDLVSGSVGVPTFGYGPGLAGVNHGPQGFELENHHDDTGGWEFAGTAMGLMEGSTKATVAAYTTIDSYSPNARIVVCPNLLTGKASPWVSIGFTRVGSSNRANLQFAEGSDPRENPSSAVFFVADSVRRLYSATKNDTTTAEYYRDGVPFSTNVQAGYGGAITIHQDYIFIFGRNQSVNDNVNGRTALNVFWKRELLAHEHALFYADPYALLKPRVPRVYYTVAGGADHDLLADGLESVSEVSKPSIGQKHVIAGDGLESAAEVSAPAIGQVHGLGADGLEAAAEVSKPAVGQVHALGADGLDAQAKVSKPAVGQLHVLLAAGLEAQAEVSKPTAAASGADHVLLAASLEAQAKVSKPSIGQDHDLAAAGLEAQAKVSKPAVGQLHVLQAAGLEAQAEVSKPTASESHALLAAGLEAQAEVSTPALVEIEADTRQPGGFLPEDQRLHDEAARRRERKQRKYEEEIREAVERIYAREEPKIAKPADKPLTRRQRVRVAQAVLAELKTAQPQVVVDTAPLARIEQLIIEHERLIEEEIIVFLLVA